MRAGLGSVIVRYGGSGSASTALLLAGLGLLAIGRFFSLVCPLV